MRFTCTDSQEEIEKRVGHTFIDDFMILVLSKTIKVNLVLSFLSKSDSSSSMLHLILSFQPMFLFPSLCHSLTIQTNE